MDNRPMRFWLNPYGDPAALTVLHAYMRLRHVDPTEVAEDARRKNQPLLEAWIKTANGLAANPENITTGCMIEGHDKGDLDAWHRRYEEVVLVRERDNVGGGFAETEEYGEVAVEVGHPVMQPSLMHQFNRLGFMVYHEGYSEDDQTWRLSPQKDAVMPDAVHDALADMGWTISAAGNGDDLILSTGA